MACRTCRSASRTALPGRATLEIFATDGSAASAPVAFKLTIDAPETDEPDAFAPLLLQAEGATVIDQNTASPPNDNDTQIRGLDNGETASSGKLLDANNLRPGHDTIAFEVTVPAEGIYTLHFRYANGGSSARPLALAIKGTANGSQAFASTGSGDIAWTVWQV